MQLNLQTYTSLVQTMAAAAQGKAAQLIDLTVGSVLRAVLEANAAVALWLQWLIFLVLGTTRAATSQGTDLDTWMADFGLTRLPASPATGMVTFARYTATTAASIPQGAVVRTGDLSQSFSVNAATTIPAGTASVNVAVTAVTAGTGGNVGAGTITVLATAIPGVDYVSNAAAFTDGVNAESDAAFRARFALYIATRAEATIAAVEYAVDSIQQGLQVTVAENTNAAGAYMPGNFVVTINDGSGDPSDTLLATCSTAINAVRPIGSTYTVQGPTVTTANVSMTIAVSSGTSKPPIQALVQAALATYIDALPIGAPLPYSRLAWIAYQASSAITDVTSVTLNSGTSDLTVGQFGTIIAGTVTVN